MSRSHAVRKASRQLWDDCLELGRSSLMHFRKSGPPSRVRKVLDRFFELAAKDLEADRPALAEELRRATTHWMRHTHATHALERGAELTTVRDNLRHATIATTSNYLHTDDDNRSRDDGGVRQALI